MVSLNPEKQECSAVPDGRPAVVGEVVARGGAEVARAAHAVVGAAQPPRAPLRQVVRVVQLRTIDSEIVNMCNTHTHTRSYIFLTVSIE